MSDLDEIRDEIVDLERKIDTLSKTFISCTTDILEALKINTEIVNELGEAMAIARSPTEEDLERSATLREAYDRYDFVRRLAISGEQKQNE